MITGALTGINAYQVARPDNDIHPGAERKIMIAVIGAGVSGLSCAWWLQQAGLDVEVFEAADRVGGKVQSVKEAGVAFETGPHTLLPDAGQYLWL